MKSALKGKMIEAIDSSMTPAANIGAIEIVFPSVKKLMLNARFCLFVYEQT